jgi:hypothetical protein
MGVKINIEIEVEDGFTIDELKQWVVEEDKIVSLNGDGIDLKYVNAGHVFLQLVSAQGGIIYKVNKAEFDDALEQLREKLNKPQVMPDAQIAGYIEPYGKFDLPEDNEQP